MDTPPQPAKPMDPGRIHPQDPGDLAVWAHDLGCSVEDLRAVIDEVGEHPTAVREALALRRGGGPVG